MEQGGDVMSSLSHLVAEALNWSDVGKVAAKSPALEQPKLDKSRSTSWGQFVEFDQDGNIEPVPPPTFRMHHHRRRRRRPQGQEKMPLPLALESPSSRASEPKKDLLVHLMDCSSLFTFETSPKCSRCMHCLAELTVEEAATHWCVSTLEELTSQSDPESDGESSSDHDSDSIVTQPTPMKKKRDLLQSPPSPALTDKSTSTPDNFGLAGGEDEGGQVYGTPPMRSCVPGTSSSLSLSPSLSSLTYLDPVSPPLLSPPTLVIDGGGWEWDGGTGVDQNRRDQLSGPAPLAPVTAMPHLSGSGLANPAATPTPQDVWSSLTPNRQRAASDCGVMPPYPLRDLEGIEYGGGGVAGGGGSGRHLPPSALRNGGRSLLFDEPGARPRASSAVVYTGPSSGLDAALFYC